MLAVGLRRIAAELLEQEIGVEYVNPHRGQTAGRVARHRVGMFRFLEKIGHAVLRVDPYDAELVSFGQWYGNTPDRHVGLGLYMLAEQLGIIHLVNVIARENHYVIRI